MIASCLIEEEKISHLNSLLNMPSKNLMAVYAISDFEPFSIK